MALKRFTILQSVYDELIDYGYEKLPFEACGLLSGKNELAKNIWKLENESKSPNHFFVNHETIRQTFLQIEQLNEKVIVAFHTHPTTNPTPSTTDIINHLDPELLMLIISYKYKTPQMKVYQITNNTFKEYPIFIASS